MDALSKRATDGAAGAPAPKRKRRTKEEIARDKAAKAAKLQEEQKQVVAQCKLQWDRIVVERTRKLAALVKKDIGDKVKASLAVEKYKTNLAGSVEWKTDLDTLKTMWLPYASAVTPPAEELSADTPVVVLEMCGIALGAVLGRTKIKNGNRMVTTEVAVANLVYYPPTQRVKLWYETVW